MKTIILKEKYKVDQETKDRIKAVDLAFYADDHALLNGKKITKALTREIDELYNAYLGNIYFELNNTLLAVEYKSLKTDPFCRDNSNPKYWIKAYMLSWLIDLDEIPMADLFYDALSKREAFRQLLQAVYTIQ